MWAQLEDQSLQMEQLRQELDARREELEQAQRSLSQAKQVWSWGGSTSPPSNPATGRWTCHHCWARGAAAAQGAVTGLSMAPAHQRHELGMSRAPPKPVGLPAVTGGDSVSWPPWQAGVELSAQVDALHAEKEVLRRSVSEKECELLSTRGLIEEKELQLSQEADKATREIRELQGRLLEKVQCCVKSPLPLCSPR